MATWGYRVYTFELFEGANTRLAQEIPEHRERLLEVLDLVGKQTRVGKPQRGVPAADEGDVDLDDAPAEDDYHNTEPTLTIRGSDYDPTLDVIHASIALGERGLHDYAINPDDGTDRVAVSDRSAETPRRVDFFFATAQFEGFLVTEAVGMKDPVPLMVPWIRSISTSQRKARLAAIDAASEHLDGEGNRISKSAARQAVPKTIKIRAQRVADPVLLQQILHDIQSMDTEFTQLDVNNKQKNKRLIVKVQEKSKQQSIVERLTTSNAGSTDSIIKQTLEDLDVDLDGLESANVDVSTVKAHIRSREGNTTLVPGQMSELFNYRFKGDGRPANTPYYRTVLAKLEQLKGPAQVAVAVPEEDELVEWVGREEAAWQPQEIPIHE